MRGCDAKFFASQAAGARVSNQYKNRQTDRGANPGAS